MTPLLVRRSPITNVLGNIKHAEAVAAQDHSGITPLLGAPLIRDLMLRVCSLMCIPMSYCSSGSVFQHGGDGRSVYSE